MIETLAWSTTKQYWHIQKIKELNEINGKKFSEKFEYGNNESHDYDFLQRLKKLLRPTPEWGPALGEHRQMYIDSLEAEKRDTVKNYVYSMEAFSHDKADSSAFI